MFFGRFVAMLRAFAAFLAGVNRLKWERSFCSTRPAESSGRRCSALGGFWLGHAFEHYAKPVGRRGADRRGHRRRPCGAVHPPSRAGARGGGRTGFSGAARASEAVRDELIVRRRCASSGGGALRGLRSTGPIHTRSCSERRRKSTLTVRSILSASSARKRSPTLVTGLAVERDDHIAGQQPGLSGRPGLLDAEDARAGRLLEAEPQRDAARDRRVAAPTPI